jgi:hypothetical protein
MKHPPKMVVAASATAAAAGSDHLQNQEDGSNSEVV